MIKLIIFDYDGLLVESEVIAFLAEEKTLNIYGKILTKELFNKYLGYSVVETVKEYLKYYALPIKINEFIAQRNKVINSLLPSHLLLKPGAKVLLDYLKNKDVDMVIGSSGERTYIEKGLQILGIAEYFKNITSVDDVINGKPHPDVFLEALKKNNTKSENAIVLEDAISGIRAAQSASIFCIAIPPPNTDLQSYRIANIIVDNLEKVKEILVKLDIN